MDFFTKHLSIRDSRDRLALAHPQTAGRTNPFTSYYNEVSRNCYSTHFVTPVFDSPLRLHHDHRDERRAWIR